MTPTLRLTSGECGRERQAGANNRCNPVCEWCGHVCENRMGLLLGQIPGSNKEQIQRAYGIRDHLVRQQTNCNHQ